MRETFKWLGLSVKFLLVALISIRNNNPLIEALGLIAQY